MFYSLVNLNDTRDYVITFLLDLRQGEPENISSLDGFTIRSKLSRPLGTGLHCTRDH